MTTESKNTENYNVVNKSNVMKAAWETLRKNKAKNFAEALRMAWRAFKLKAQLTLGEVRFKFRKMDGSIREAVGTLAKNMFYYESKGTGRKRPASLICYFDLEKKAFRSFNVWSLI